MSYLVALLGVIPFVVLGYVIPFDLARSGLITYFIFAIVTGWLRFSDMVKAAGELRRAKTAGDRTRLRIKMEYQNIKLLMHLRMSVTLFAFMSVATALSYFKHW